MPLLIFVNKGIEIGTHALTLEIIADTCGPEIAKAATFIVSDLEQHITNAYAFVIWSVCPFSQGLLLRKKVGTLLPRQTFRY